MALVVKDRVKDTTSTTGTGTVTLDNSPPDGYQAFSSIGNGSTTYYAIEDANKTGWEVGLGTYTLSGHTLARTTVLASSNSGSAITLSSGSHTVFTDYAAGKAFLSDEGLNKSFVADGAITAGKPTILKTDGKAEQVQATVPTTPTLRNTGTGWVNPYSGGWYPSESNVYCAAQEKFVIVWNDTNQYPNIQAYSVANDGTVTFGTTTILKSVGSYGSNAINISGSTIVIAYGDNSGKPTYVYLRAATLSGTTFTLGTEIEASSESSYYNGTEVNVVWDANADAGVLTWLRRTTDTHTDGLVYSKVFTLSGTTFTLGSETAVGSTDSGFGNTTHGYYCSPFALRSVYDPDNQLIVSVRSYPSSYGTESVDAYVGTVTGGVTRSVSWGVKQTIHANTAGAVSGVTQIPEYPKMVDAKYDTVNNRMIVSHIDDNSSTTLANWKLNVANCTINSGSTITVNSTTEAGAYGLYPSLANISDQGYYLMSSVGFATDTTIFYKVLPSTSAVTNTVLTTSTYETTRTAGLAYSPDTTSVSFPSYNAAHSTSFTYDYVIFPGAFITTYNLDTTNYLGVASTTVADTETVNVNVPGSINGDQTGLTIGSNYFSNTSGVVGTSGTQFLGKAISSTELALEEEPDNNLFGTADGAITAGKPVIVEADGDFAEVTGTRTSYAKIESGMQMIISSGATDKYGLASNGSGVYCAVWEGTSSYPNTVIGNAASGGLTYGSTVVIRSSACDSISVSYSSEEAYFVSSHMETNNQFNTKIEFSGTTATATNIGGATGYGVGSGAAHMVSIYDSTEDVHMFFLSNATSKIGTLTDTQAESTGYRSFSAVVGSSASDCQAIGVAWDQTNNVGVAWWSASANSDYPTVRAFTVDGSGNGSITFGTAVVLESNGTDLYGGIACGSPNSAEFVAVWKDTTTELRYNTMTLSGTTITIGTAGAVTRDGSEEYYVEGSQLLTYNPKSKKYYFSYNNSADNYDIMLKELSYSGGSVTTDSTIKIIDSPTGNGHYWNVVYTGGTTAAASATMILIGRYDSNNVGSAQYSPAWDDTTTNLTTENYTGIAQATVADTAIVTVETVGAVNSSQSGLTAGQLYYVQFDGTISTSADSPSVVAGIGLSATELLVTKS